MFSYDRMNPDVDNSGFGSDWLEARSALPADEKPDWVLARSPALPFWFPPGRSESPAGLVPERTGFLAPCRATFLSGIVDRGPATLMYPDPALVLERDGRPFLLRESCWHSNLHFWSNFRADASTNWQWRWTPVETQVRIDETCVVVYSQLNSIYFHWFFDVLSKIWLFREHMGAVRLPFFIGDTSQGFKRDSLAMLGIGPDQILAPPGEDVPLAFADAYLPVWSFAEPLKTRFARDSGVHHKGWSPLFVAAIREIALAHFGIAPGPKDLKLYVDRSDAHYRRVLNEAEVREFCVSNGFTAVVPGRMTLAEQVETFSRARVVVGCHGAGLTNILWSGMNTAVVEFMPNGFDDAGYRFLSGLIGADYACLFSHSSETGLDNFQADCRVDLGALRRILDGL